MRQTRVAYVAAPAPAADVHPGTSGLTEAALVFALLGLGVLAILFGHRARTNIARTGRSGDGLAVAALILGYLETVGLIVGIALGTR